MTNLGLLHRGSVKDIYRINARELLFRFSDRYSIFDWGEMPDAIPHKGHALASMGCKFLEYLEHRGFKTHYLGRGDEPNSMRVRSVTVPRDGVSVYQARPTSILIPLEVIFRLGAPKGSSLLRRLKTEADWFAAGYDRVYKEGEFFKEVKIDFTTKLERQDRVLSDGEAKSLAGMNGQEWEELKDKTKKIAAEIKTIFARFGAVLWDGKFEFAFDEERKIILVDSIGLDEMRLTFEGIPLSKELLRQYYLGSPWYLALSNAKETHPSEFKEYCKNALHAEPSPLPTGVVSAVSDIYGLLSSMILCEGEKRYLLQEKLRSALRALTGGAP